jgi:hypothetical protein
MPVPKSASLATSPLLSTSEAAVCEQSGVGSAGAEIDAVFVFFIEFGAGNVVLAVVDKKGAPLNACCRSFRTSSMRALAQRCLLMLCSMSFVTKLQGTFGRVTQRMSRIRNYLCKWGATACSAM